MSMREALERLKTGDGGTAFPSPTGTSDDGDPIPAHPGMSLRDYFAAHVRSDDKLVLAVRALDDRALAFFALFNCEPREGWEAEVDDAADYLKLPNEVAKVVYRLSLEARALARVRYMQADAMLEARDG